jgi:hypothetical protein
MKIETLVNFFVLTFDTTPLSKLPPLFDALTEHAPTARSRGLAAKTAAALREAEKNGTLFFGQLEKDLTRIAEIGKAKPSKN